MDRSLPLDAHLGAGVDAYSGAAADVSADIARGALRAGAGRTTRRHRTVVTP